MLCDIDSPVTSGEAVESDTDTDEEEKMKPVEQEEADHNTRRSVDVMTQTTQADINKLNYRALQKKCKSVGVSAAGSTVALRERLYEHFGLSVSEVSLYSIGFCCAGYEDVYILYDVILSK